MATRVVARERRARAEPRRVLAALLLRPVAEGAAPAARAAPESLKDGAVVIAARKTGVRVPDRSASYADGAA